MGLTWSTEDKSVYYMEEKSNQEISCIEFIAKWGNKILHIFLKFPAVTRNN